MNEQKYELIPSCGWLKFESHDDVTNKIWDTLKLRDNGARGYIIISLRFPLFGTWILKIKIAYL